MSDVQRKKSRIPLFARQQLALKRNMAGIEVVWSFDVRLGVPVVDSSSGQKEQEQRLGKPQYNCR